MRHPTFTRIWQALVPAGITARLAVVLALSGALFAACDVHGTTGPGVLASITVTPNVTMGISTTQQFVAVGRDAEGAVVSISPTWSVVASGGTIASGGLFTAGVLPGTYTATIMAASGGISGTASVVVIVGTLTTITVSPNPQSMAINGTQAFTAVGRDGGGNIVAMIPTWSVASGGGTIGLGGLFTAGTLAATFTNTVTASNGTVSGTATVTVTPGPLATITVTPNPDSLLINGTQLFTAVGRDAGGNVVAIVPAWSVVAGGGSIVAGSGLFTAGALTGSFPNTVRATSGLITGNATVVVSAGVLATITVSPNPANLLTSGAQLFTAVGRDAGNNILPITPVWSVVAAGGSIAANGLFTAGGTTGAFVNTVRATSGLIFGSATVNVAAGALATITVSPNPDTLLAGGTRLFTAVGRDALNNIVPITPVWSVTASGGLISGGGLFTAGVVSGTFVNTVRATSGLIFGTATMTVNPIVLPPIVPLGTAALNGIMAGTAVTCITGGLISADVAISPGNTITGFGPCVITGTQHLADAVALTAQGDLTTAYNGLFGLPCPPANAIVADLGGTTKAAGVYCTASGIGVTGTLTLDGGGDPNANFVFQAGTSLITAGNVVLINGAQAKNVWWQVGTSATLGTASQWKGNILALTSITLVDNANLIGRALARNGAVSLGTNNTITLP